MDAPWREKDPGPEPPWRRRESEGMTPAGRKRTRPGVVVGTPAEDPDGGVEPCTCKCAEDVDPEDSDVDMPLEVDGEIINMTRCVCRECPGLGGRRCRSLLALREGLQPCECFACTSTHGGEKPRKRTSVFASPNASYTRTETSYHFKKGETTEKTKS